VASVDFREALGLLQTLNQVSVSLQQSLGNVGNLAACDRLATCVAQSTEILQQLKSANAAPAEKKTSQMTAVDIGTELERLNEEIASYARTGQEVKLIKRIQERDGMRSDKVTSISRTLTSLQSVDAAREHSYSILQKYQQELSAATEPVMAEIASLPSQADNTLSTDDAVSKYTYVSQLSQLYLIMK